MIHRRAPIQHQCPYPASVLISSTSAPIQHECSYPAPVLLSSTSAPIQHQCSYPAPVLLSSTSGPIQHQCSYSAPGNPIQHQCPYPAAVPLSSSSAPVQHQCPYSAGEHQKIAGGEFFWACSPAQKIPKASSKKRSIMKHSPGLPQDTKSLRSSSGYRAKRLLNLGIKCHSQYNKVIRLLQYSFSNS